MKASSMASRVAEALMFQEEEEEVEIGYEMGIEMFDTAGVMSGNAGLFVTMPNGEKFEITVKRAS